MLQVRRKKRRRKAIAGKVALASKLSPRARAILDRTKLARLELDRRMA